MILKGCFYINLYCAQIWARIYWNKYTNSTQGRQLLIALGHYNAQAHVIRTANFPLVSSIINIKGDISNNFKTDSLKKNIYNQNTVFYKQIIEGIMRSQ